MWNTIYPRSKGLSVLGSGQVFSRSILEQAAWSLVRRTDFLIHAISFKIENVEFILLGIDHDLRLRLLNKAGGKEMRLDTYMSAI